MKHKRRTHKKSHSKRRSKGALHGLDMTNILGVVAGAVGISYLAKMLPDTIDKKIVAGGKIVAGAVLPMLVKGGKMKNIVAGVGSGMIAVGSVELMQSFGILSGADDETLDISLNGDLDILAGNDDLSVVQGLDDETVLAGYNKAGRSDLSVVQGMDEDEF